MRFLRGYVLVAWLRSTNYHANYHGNAWQKPNEPMRLWRDDGPNEQREE